MATAAIKVAIFCLTALFLPSCLCLFDTPLQKQTFHVHWTSSRLESIIERLGPIGNAVDKLKRGGEPATQLANQVHQTIKKAIRNNPNRISEQCASDLLYYAKNANNNYVKDNSSILWNRQILDSFGTLSVNTLDDFRIYTGDYEQCLLLNVHKECDASNEGCQVNTKPDFEGKYCLARVDLNVRPTFDVGTCIPSTCSALEMNYIFYTANITGISVYLFEDQCHTKSSHNNWDTTSKIILIFFVILCGFVVVATVRDIILLLRKGSNNSMTETNQGTFIKILTAFSAYKNTKKIFNTERREGSDLGCIDGIRAISMSWIVIGHIAAQFYMTTPFKNPMETRYLVQNFWTQCLINAEFGVDTFIFITGFLLLFSTMKYLAKTGGKFNLGQFYFHRVIRITPAYAVILAFVCGIFIHTSSGPLWPDIATFHYERCRKTWWRNILYISVYYGEQEQCLTQAWYLCLDAFYYVVSPLIFLPLFRKPKPGLILLIVWVTASIALPGYLIHAHELASTNTWQMRKIQRDDYLYEVYSKPWSRMHVFLIGMVCGLMYYRKRDNAKLNKVFVTIMWLLVAAMMLLLIYGTHPYSSGQRNMTRAMFTFYGTLSRPAWAVGLSWITLSCLMGYGGVVNTILTWKLFIPLSRLSYSYYLVHYTLIVHFLAHRKENITFELYLMSFWMIATFILSSVFAYILSMLTESPIMELEKTFLNKAPKSPTNDPKEGKKVKNDETKEPLVAEATNDYETERGYDTADSEVYWEIKTENENYETTNK